MFVKIVPHKHAYPARFWNCTIFHNVLLEIEIDFHIFYKTSAKHKKTVRRDAPVRYVLPQDVFGKDLHNPESRNPGEATVCQFGSWPPSAKMRA